MNEYNHNYVADPDGNFYYMVDESITSGSIGSAEQLRLQTEDVPPIIFSDDSYHIKTMHFRPNGSVRQIDFYKEDEL